MCESFSLRHNSRFRKLGTRMESKAHTSKFSLNRFQGFFFLSFFPPNEFREQIPRIFRTDFLGPQQRRCTLRCTQQGFTINPVQASLPAHGPKPQILVGHNCLLRTISQIPVQWTGDTRLKTKEVKNRSSRCISA